MSTPTTGPIIAPPPADPDGNNPILWSGIAFVFSVILYLIWAGAEGTSEEQRLLVFGLTLFTTFIAGLIFLGIFYGIANKTDPGVEPEETAGIIKKTGIVFFGLSAVLIMAAAFSETVFKFILNSIHVILMFVAAFGALVAIIVALVKKKTGLALVLAIVLAIVAFNYYKYLKVYGKKEVVTETEDTKPSDNGKIPPEEADPDTRGSLNPKEKVRKDPHQSDREQREPEGPEYEDFIKAENIPTDAGSGRGSLTGQ